MGLPICLGYFPVSFAYGMSVVLSGMPAWAAVLISLTNLTSAGQFAGSSLMLAGGSYLEIAVTTVVINIRYFLMSLAMSQKTDKKMINAMIKNIDKKKRKNPIKTVKPVKRIGREDIEYMTLLGEEILQVLDNIKISTGENIRIRNN